MRLSLLPAYLRAGAQDDGSPICVPDWPERGSPVPRLTLSIDEGRCVLRSNAAWRQLVRSTAPAENPPQP